MRLAVLFVSAMLIFASCEYVSQENSCSLSESGFVGSDKYEVIFTVQSEPPEEPVQTEPADLTAYDYTPDYSIWNINEDIEAYFSEAEEALLNAPENEYDTAYISMASDYLINNGVELSAEFDFDALNSEFGDLGENALFFVWEGGYIEKNYESRLDLIKFFHEKYGVRHIVYEIGFSDSHILNEYITTGNPAYLEAFTRAFPDQPLASSEHIAFLESLREYNENFDDNNKLMLIGIDVEHSQRLCSIYLQLLIRKYEIPDGLRENLVQITTTVGNRQALNKDVNGLRNIIEDNYAAFSRFFGEDMFLFEFTIRNFIQASNFNLEGDVVLREKAMADNLAVLMDYYEARKYFAMLGGFGTGRDHITGSLPVIAGYFANYSEKTKGKAVNLVYEYPNPPADGGLQEDMATVEYLYNTAGLMESQCKLINLKREESPFTGEGRLYDGYDFMLIIKDSEADSPR